MDDLDSPPSVVVGIDGSSAAVGAALWGIDEAVARDIPLRLVYAIDPRETVCEDADDFTHQLATAEIAIRYAFMAVEASRRPVKIEIEIVQGQPVATLIRASKSAAMVCLGASRSPSLQRVGSTASTVMSSAHCPVAILRGYDRVVRGSGGWVAVELEKSPENAVVVQHAVGEARLRQAELRVLTRCPSRETGYEKERAVPGPQLAGWIRQFPDVAIRCVAVRDSVVDYLNENLREVKLVVVGTNGLGQGEAGASPAGRQSLVYDTDCPVLITRGNLGQPD